jgi:hypothetical protein
MGHVDLSFIVLPIFIYHYRSISLLPLTFFIHKISNDFVCLCRVYHRCHSYLFLFSCVIGLYNRLSVPITSVWANVNGSFIELST